MHYIKEYSGDNMQHEAIRDVLSYLGYSCFKRLVRHMKKYKKQEEPLENWTVALHIFAGIEGYPAKALYERYLSDN